MKSERGWRWDVPTPPKGVREEPNTQDAVRRAEAAAAVGETSIHDFVAEAAVAVDGEQLRRALHAAVGWASAGLPASLVLHPHVEGGDGADLSPPAGAVAVPIRVDGGKTWGAIHLGSRPSESPAEAGLARRRLESLAKIAALGFERLTPSPRRAEPADEVEHPAEQAGGVHDATLLSAVLPFALGQARRHKEPLSILCVAINQLRGVRELFGPAEADRVVACVGTRIAGLLRSSDLICRLDDDRLMVVLPRVELRDAVQVGRKLARKIAEAVDLAGLPIPVTLAVGAASFPATATTLGSLLDAADLALEEARRARYGDVSAPGRADEGSKRSLVGDRGRFTC